MHTVIPESDWSETQPVGIVDFRIRHRITLKEASVDVRQYCWVAPETGQVHPHKHYIDFSLDMRPRHSAIRSQHWTGPRNPGGLLYLAPDQIYVGEPARERRNLLCIALSKQFIADVFAAEGDTPELLPRLDIQNGSMQRLLTNLAGELGTPGFASDMYAHSILMQLAIELSRFQGDRMVGASTSRTVGRRIHHVKEFIAENIGRELNIVDIAQECGVSPRHLARLFKNEIGVSLGEYIASIRIATAKDLLRAGSVSVKEVAFACGFQRASAFSTAFRVATGVTPLQYRRMIQG